MSGGLLGLGTGVFPRGYVADNPTALISLDFARDRYRVGSASARRFLDLPGAAALGVNAWELTGLAITAPYTMFCEVEYPTTPAPGQYALEASNGTNAQRSLIYVISDLPPFAFAQFTSVGGVAQATTRIAGASTGAQTAKIATRTQANSLRLAANGALGNLVSSASTPTGLNRLKIGASTSGSSPGSQFVRRAVLFPYAMTDAELQALTA